MKNVRGFWHLFLVSAFCMVLFFGCSSLPKETVHNSERNSKASSLMELGHKYYLAGQYEKAGTCYENALDIHASVDDGALVAMALTSLGRIKTAQGQLDVAETYFQQAHLAAQSLNRPELEAQALGGLGTVELHRGQPMKAISWLETALELPLADPGNTRATLLHDLGSAHRKLGNMDSAESYFRLALAMHEPLRNLTGIAADCYSSAWLHEAEGDYVLALENARRALSHDKRTENAPAVAQDLTLLGSLSLANDELEPALDYSRRAKLAWQALGREDRVEDIGQTIQRIESP